MTAAAPEKLAMPGRFEMSPQEELIQSFPCAPDFSAALSPCFRWALQTRGNSKACNLHLKERRN